MNIDQLHRAVKLELDKTDSLNYTSFLPEEIDYWLNRSIETFVKTRYSGTNPKRESFEQTQKRIDDLRTLVVESAISTINNKFIPTANFSNKPDSFTAAIPTNYWFTLGEEALIAFEHPSYFVTYNSSDSIEVGSVYKVVSGTVTYNSITKTVGEAFIATQVSFTGNGIVKKLVSQREGITEATTDTYRQFIDNPFGAHILHYYEARPLRLFSGESVELLGNGEYFIPIYYLRYLKKPARVNVLTDIVTSIEEGLTYYVVSGTVSYNNVTYTQGQTFVGIRNLTIIAGSGPVVKLYKTECDLPEHTHAELVKLTVSMIVENIGDVNRYQTSSTEIGRME